MALYDFAYGVGVKGCTTRVAYAATRYIHGCTVAYTVARYVRVEETSVVLAVHSVVVVLLIWVAEVLELVYRVEWRCGGRQVVPLDSHVHAHPSVSKLQSAHIPGQQSRSIYQINR